MPNRDLKILYLVYYGYEKTVIDSQVLVPVEELMKRGVSIHLLFFESISVFLKTCFSSFKYSAEHQLHNVPFSVFPRVPRNFLWLNTVQLFIWMVFAQLKGIRRFFIHARGIQGTDVALPLKKIFSQTKILCDVRGVEAEEYDYLVRSKETQALSMSQRYWKNALLRATKRALKHSDFVTFVSLSMRHDLSKFAGIEEQATLYIPCAVKRDRFDQALSIRASLRRKWGFDNKLVFVYSGMMGKWHATEQIPVLFSLIKKMAPESFFLGLTPDEKEMTALFEKNNIHSDSFKIQSVRFDEVDSYLVASDAGFLLREDHPLNKYSCPTKFAEYCAAGLFVFASTAIDDVKRIITENNNGFIVDLQETQDKLSERLGPALAAVRDTENRIARSLHVAELFDWKNFIPLLEKKVLEK